MSLFHSVLILLMIDEVMSFDSKKQRNKYAQSWVGSIPIRRPMSCFNTRLPTLKKNQILKKETEFLRLVV